MRIRTITMPDDDSGELIIPNPDAGYAGEGNATMLVVTVPAAYAAYSKYLEFEPAGAKVPPYGPLGDGLTEFSFLLPSTVTKNGRLKVQLVIKSGDTTVKSAEGMLYVKKSIGASNRETNWSSSLVQLSHAACVTNGSIRLYWNANISTILTIPVSVIYSV